MRTKTAKQSRRSPAGGGHDRLTKREAEVLVELARGWSNREIAAKLRMSIRTAQKHLEWVYLKLGVRNRTEAAIRVPAWLTPRERRRLRKRNLGRSDWETHHGMSPDVGAPQLTSR